MATLKMVKRKTKAKRSSGTKFLVVRGRGNTVYLAPVRAIEDAELASAIGRAKPGRGVAKASRAFILKGKREAEKFIGVRLHLFGP
jgi:hypothetical protein